MTMSRRLLLAGAATSATATPALAQLGNILLGPKTIVEHAVESRSFADQAKDNEIVLKVNAVMAKIGTLQADTEIYEQRLLITGLFDDRSKYDRFYDGVKGVAGVKKLYWHAVYESADAQKADKNIIGWATSVALATKAGANLTIAMKTTEQNYHVCVDSFAVAYVIGRAKSAAERGRAIASVRGTEGVRKVVDYIDVRA